MAGHINCLRLTRFNEKDRRDTIKQRVTVSNIYALLTTREVKMAGYWPSSYFAFLWTKTKSRSIKTQKKERGQYPAILTEQAWSIKDLLYGQKVTNVYPRDFQNQQ